jgi:hypothetical protein
MKAKYLVFNFKTTATTTTAEGFAIPNNLKKAATRMFSVAYIVPNHR